MTAFHPGFGAQPPDVAPRFFPDRMLLHALLLSLVLHLALILGMSSTPVTAPTEPGRKVLNLRLPVRVQAVTVTNRAPGASLSPVPRPSRSAATTALPGDDREASSTSGPSTALDLDALRATARSLAREADSSQSEPQTRNTPMASAIAAAGDEPSLIESRGTAGERVTRYGKLRCVMPSQVPPHLQGMTIIPLCSSEQR